MNAQQDVQKGLVLPRPAPARQDTPFRGKAATRSKLGQAPAAPEPVPFEPPRFTSRRIRRGTFVNAAEMVRRQCPAKTKLEAFFNILTKWAFHFVAFPGSLISSWL